MPRTVDDPRLDTLEQLVSEASPKVALHKELLTREEWRRRLDAAKAESDRMAEVTNQSQEWFYLESRLGRYEYEFEKQG